MSKNRKKRAQGKGEAEPTDLGLPGPGAMLRAARGKRGLSRKEVAVKLRLDLGVISALEDDNYDELPEPIFVSGYLRSYAKLLDIPEDSVMDSYRPLGFEPPPVVPAVRGKPQARSSDRMVRTITFLVVVLFIGLSLVWWWRSRGPEQSLAVSLAPVEQAAPVAPPTPGDVAVPAEPPPPSVPAAAPQRGPESEAPAPIAALPPVVSAVPGAEPEPAASAPEVMPATADEPPAIASHETVTPPDASSVLILHFAEDSWIEVRDASGKRLLYGLGRAGTDRTTHGVPPYGVFLGYAAGVTVEYNGQSFDHSPYIRGNLARFTVGEAGAASE